MYTKLLLGLLTCFFLTTTATLAQKALPAAQVRTLDGKSVDIREYARKGKPTVLSFWATWCAPCKKELDAIKALYPDWQQQFGVELVAVSIDDQRALPKIAPMVQSKGWPFTVLTDTNQQLKNALNVHSIPQTFLLDGQGNITYTHTGYLPGDELELEKKIREAAGK
jgi:peroxiredoxin